MPASLPEFHREYLVRLPLPLAQLYSRAFNAKEARARHDNAFYLFESIIKLAAAPAIAAYLTEVQHGVPRVAALDRLLAQLALPSLGQWVAMLRELARHFGARPDAAAHPLGHLWGQLDPKRRDLPAIVALYRRIKNGPDGQPAGDQSCSLLDLLDGLVQYRNGVFGHGASRFDAFYEQEMGPLLLPAASELLAEGVWDMLGPRGSRLVYLTELRTVDERQVQISLMELVGRESERMAPQELATDEAAGLTPNCVAVLWPGRKVPLRLDPLLVFRGTELAEEVLFLNRDRNGRQAEYLSYTTGRTERDRSMGPALAKLLSQVAGREVSEEELQKIGEQSLAETPSVEALFGPGAPTVNQVGDYEILAEIGRGGMGVVYLARQLSLGRLVALKMLPADLAADEVALARFRREMRALGRCEHPHIVKVLANGTLPDGRLYYTMEYVPGADLEMTWRELAGPNRQGAASSLSGTTWSKAILTASRKQREVAARHAAESSAASSGDRSSNSPGVATSGLAPNAKDTAAASIPPVAVAQLPLPPLPELPSAENDPGGYSRRVAQLVHDAALALQAVHEQGIVHRDVKPANLMLTPDGQRVVLMDFGLAKGQSVSLSASKAGGLLGTLRYAAPEQLAAASLKVGPTADVRGLGVTLWELLTRERLFGDAEDEKQLAALVYDRDVPRLRSVDPTLDADLEAIVARATERRVADRIQTAGRLAEYLQLYLDGKPLPIRPPSAAELLRRWVREHKGLVGTAAAAAAAIVLTVTIAFISITAAKNDAVKARDDAVQAKNHEAEAKNRAIQLANEKSQLADEMAKLAETERQSRRRAEAAEAATAAENKKVERQLVLLYIDRAINELETGDKRLGLAILGQAYRAARNDPELRASTCALLGSWYGSAYRRLDYDGLVLDATFSPDGTKVVTASQDTTMRLWNAATGNPLGEPLRHAGLVQVVAFSPDGSKVLTAGVLLHNAQLWDVASGKLLGEFHHEKPVLAVAFSPDGTKVLTGGDDHTARLWDAATQKPLGEPLRHDSEVRIVAFSPDGTKALTGCNNEARLWDAATGKPLGEPLRHNDLVKAVAFSPDGTKVLTGSIDKTARLWDAATGQPLGEPLSHDAAVLAVAFSPDGTKLLTGSGTNTKGEARLWDATAGKPIGQPLRHDRQVQAVAFSPDGAKVLTGSFDETARLWDAATGQPLGEALPHDSWWVSAVAFSPDGGRMLVRSGGWGFGGQARLWNEIASRSLGEPLPNDGEVPAVAFSPDGLKMLTGSSGDTARLWDAATGKLLREPLRFDGLVRAVSFSRDGTRILTQANRGYILGSESRVWDAATGKQIGKPVQYKGYDNAAAFSPDGAKVLIATGTDTDAQTRLWDTTTGKPLGEPLPYHAQVGAVDFSPDGNKLLTGSTDKTARLWDAATGKALGEPLRHDDGVWAVAFSPDGNKVITGSRDHTARLWDAATGKSLGEPLRHDGMVNAVSFSPDGTKVLTGSYDRTARLWDVATGKPLGAPFRGGHDNSVLAVSFSRDGNQALLGTWNKSAWLWRLPSSLPDEPKLVEAAVSFASGLVEDSAGVLRPATSEQQVTAWHTLTEVGGEWLKKRSEDAQRDALVWHQVEATDFESHNLWFAAAFHLGYLIAHDPTDADLHRRRARAYTKLGQLDKAAADNAAADKQAH